MDIKLKKILEAHDKMLEGKRTFDRRLLDKGKAELDALRFDEHCDTEQMLQEVADRLSDGQLGLILEMQMRERELQRKANDLLTEIVVGGGWQYWYEKRGEDNPLLDLAGLLRYGRNIESLRKTIMFAATNIGYEKELNELVYDLDHKIDIALQKVVA